MDSLRLLGASAASLALVLGAAGDALAQAKYPARMVEVVVPYAPGGGTDKLMRMITGIIDENKWSLVPMNVNNRAGGSGAVGFNYLINKKGDSHVVAGATPMAGLGIFFMRPIAAVLTVAALLAIGVPAARAILAARRNAGRARSASARA
jgi:putative tricarboxylic transport membrane protein